MQVAVLLFAFLAGNGEDQERTVWLKLDQAKCASSRTGKPILVYVACDPITGRLV